MEAHWIRTLPCDPEIRKTGAAAIEPTTKRCEGRSATERRSAAYSPAKRCTLPQNSVRTRLAIDGHRERHTESELFRATIHLRQACLHRTVTMSRQEEERMLPLSFLPVCNTATEVFRSSGIRERHRNFELVRSTMIVRVGLAPAKRRSTRTESTILPPQATTLATHLEKIISVCVFFPLVHPRIQTAEEHPRASGTRRGTGATGARVCFGRDSRSTGIESGHTECEVVRATILFR